MLLGEVPLSDPWKKEDKHMKKKNVLSVGMAVMLAASMPMAVFADETVTGGGYCGDNCIKYNHSNI